MACVHGYPSPCFMIGMDGQFLVSSTPCCSGIARNDAGEKNPFANTILTMFCDLCLYLGKFTKVCADLREVVRVNSVPPPPLTLFDDMLSWTSCTAWPRICTLCWGICNHRMNRRRASSSFELSRKLQQKSLVRSARRQRRG